MNLPLSSTSDSELDLLTEQLTIENRVPAATSVGQLESISSLMMDEGMHCLC